VLAILLGALTAGQRRIMDQNKIVSLLGKEGPFGEKNDSSTRKEVTVDRSSAIPIIESGVAGSFSIYLMRDPSFEAFSQGVSGTDRFLGVWLDGAEWDALFFDVLACPDDIHRLPNEERAEWEERYNLKFREAIPEYPMLGRISDLFMYTSYTSQEIITLRNECLKIQSTTSNAKAVQGLAKLLAACDEASKVGSGLLLAPQ
jgi:hypothetical protein